MDGLSGDGTSPISAPDGCFLPGCNKTRLICDFTYGDSDFHWHRTYMTDWDRIVASHGDAVWRKAGRLLGNQADAADCYQDAFLAALEFSRRQKVRSWPGLLSKLAAFKAMDILRKRVRHSRGWNGLADRAATASPGPGCRPDTAITVNRCGNR